MSYLLICRKGKEKEVFDHWPEVILQHLENEYCFLKCESVTHIFWPAGVLGADSPHYRLTKEWTERGKTFFMVKQSHNFPLQICQGKVDRSDRIQTVSHFLDSNSLDSKSWQSVSSLCLLRRLTKKQKAQMSAAWMTGHPFVESQCRASGKLFCTLQLYPEESEVKSCILIRTQEAMRNCLTKVFLIDREENEKWPGSSSSQVSSVFCSVGGSTCVPPRLRSAMDKALLLCGLHENVQGCWGTMAEPFPYI